MTEAMKSCPFCGGEGRVIPDPGNQYRSNVLYRPQCDRCGGGLGGFDTSAFAVAAWNRRAPADVEMEEMTRLREDCPPVGYPTDKTRCLPCPRLALIEKCRAEFVSLLKLAGDTQIYEGAARVSLRHALRTRASAAVAACDAALREEACVSR